MAEVWGGNFLAAPQWDGGGVQHHEQGIGFHKLDGGHVYPDPQRGNRHMGLGNVQGGAGICSGALGHLESISRAGLPVDADHSFGLPISC